MRKKVQPAKPKLITPAIGYRGMTQLHYAAYCNDPDAIRTQLQAGISVDVRDDNGWTPLHWSIDMSQACGEPEEVVSLLLSAGAVASAVDNSGFSVLMMACGRNNKAIFDQLIESGAEISARSSTGITALHEAAGCNFTEAISGLLVLGADPAQTDQWNRMPEQVAEICGFEDSVNVLKAARLAKETC